MQGLQRLLRRNGLSWLPSRLCPPLGRAQLVQWHSPCGCASPPHTSAEMGRNRRGAHSGARLLAEAAASDGAAGSALPASAGALALKQLTLQLPQFCCGCGIRLQRTQPDEPGYFIVPAKLLAPPEEAEDVEDPALEDALTMQLGPDAPPEDVYQQARAQLEAENQAALEERRRSGEESETSGGSSLPAVLCQRCFSLKQYGKVKSEAAESMLPEFDLGKKVGRKIFLQKDRRAVVLCVVDVADFDGSLPRKALQSLFPPGASTMAAEDLKFRLMVAVNKFDLLPKEATPMRVTQWVRTRLAASGLPRPDEVFMVSANKMMGIQSLVDGIKGGLGFRGDLWVVGAQNAGKSSLINAMKKLGGTAGQRDPTVAPMPGTTLNLINVPGLPLGPKHRAFDTPGVAHEYQITSRLLPSEIKRVLPSKRLIGRTFRVAAGNTLLLGGLARIDLLDAPAATLYLTVFVSHAVDLHMGKTEGVEERWAAHAGRVLGPPDGVERVAALPDLQPRDVSVECNNWQRSTVDVAIAGLGWVAVGCAGRADLRVWTYPGIAVTTHAALIPDFASTFEKPGFSKLLPKSPSINRPSSAARDEQENFSRRSSSSSSSRQGSAYTSQQLSDRNSVVGQADGLSRRSLFEQTAPSGNRVAGRAAEADDDDDDDSEYASGLQDDAQDGLLERSMSKPHPSRDQFGHGRGRFGSSDGRGQGSSSRGRSVQRSRAL